MKVVIGLLALFGLGWCAVYFLGGYTSFDPSKQGIDARLNLAPGMGWEEVFEITTEPQRYRPILMKKKRIGGETMEFLEPGPPNKFNRDGFAQRLADNGLPHGFTCTFTYSSSVAFTVTFDGTGQVTSIHDAPTMADLLQYKD